MFLVFLVGDGRVLHSERWMVWAPMAFAETCLFGDFARVLSNLELQDVMSLLGSCHVFRKRHHQQTLENTLNT